MLKRFAPFLAFATLLLIVSSTTPVVAQPSPTPDVSGTAKRVRQLDQAGGEIGYGLKLGQMLQALWRGRLSGAAATVATPGPVFDIAASKVTINGEQVSVSAATAVAMTGITTSSGQFRKVTLCVDRAGTLRKQIGAIAASQAAALKPACADSEAEIGYIEIPASFTGTSTAVTAGMLKQSATTAAGVQF